VGTLRNLTSFPPLSSTFDASLPHPMYACEPLTSSNNSTLLAFNTTSEAVTPKKIALVFRGHCSFSHKVRVAQARGADAVLVADDVRREGEMDEEGRERDGLLTMYSPGQSRLALVLCEKVLIFIRFILANQTIPTTFVFHPHLYHAHRTCLSGTCTMI
jgi:hypothetical protein